MLAIQNQISVLTKILTTKIQHQQILEHQQAVSATLSKIASPPPARSRKSSSNQDASSQSGSIKEKVSTVPMSVSSNERLNEAATNVNLTKDSVHSSDKTNVQEEGTGCSIS